MVDSLAPEAVLPRLRGRFGRDYRYVERCGSTQQLMPDDAPEGAVVVADEQTKGRGRLGRRWLAQPGTSILLSIMLRPVVAGDRLPELTLVAAKACAEAIHEVTGLRPEVKDPNDVLVGGRKVAGVLGEARGPRVVLGIGINVNLEREQLPTGVDKPATSLQLELDAPVDRAELLAALLERLETSYRAWATRAAER